MGKLPGAAAYIQPEKTVSCRRCNKPFLAWVQSKNGRWYLAYTAVSQDDHKDLRVVMPWQPHRCEAQS
jgi:hypothetical protein